MKDLVNQWIQDRLGVLINMSPELFAQTVKDGYLLSQILRSYDVITEDQLNTIEKSDSPEICLLNFKNHISIWLDQLGIKVPEEDLFQIVNSKGTSALNLFYKIYLELNTKTNLDVVTSQRLNEKMQMESRFTIEEVKKTLMANLPTSKCKQAIPIEKNYDIVHWQRDLLEILKNKCIQAREDYMEYVRSKSVTPGEFICPAFTTDEVAIDVRSEAESVDLSYDELVEQQKYARNLEEFVPDSQKSKKILNKLKLKQKRHEENDIFKRELQREILAAFWNRVNLDDEDVFNKQITESLLKQSLYEKQMLQKVAEVKLQKQVMLENQQILDDAIAKQKDADFVERLLLAEKEMDEAEFTYYFEKERVLLLHRKIYEEKLRLRAERHYNMCMDAVRDIVNASLKEIEYKKEFGVEPSRRIKDSWKKMFVASVPFYDYVCPLEDIIREVEDTPEEIIHLEIDRQERIDEQDFESYMTFEWPWEIENVEIEEDILYEMECGLNVLGNVVYNILVVKYPFPPLPLKPDFPNITITACINGLPETSWLPVLQKILDERQVLVVEIQDGINYCINAYKQEIKVEVEDTVEDDKKGKGKGKGKGKEKDSKKDAKSKKGEKPKAKEAKEKGKKGKGKPGKEPAAPKIEKVDKTVQTPRIYPCEEIPLSSKAQLGKTAHEMLNAGTALTAFLTVAMFVEYLKSKPDIKGWVLINYPETYVEATMLEEALTGLPVPDLDVRIAHCKSIYDVADLEKKTQDVVDKNEESRKSKLLPSPVAKPKPEFYDTALTAYIKAKLVEEESDGLDSPPIFEDLEDDDPLNRFYADLGCNYSFYYQKFDFNTIKYLGKLIIGDFSLPMKTSVEIFGDSIRYVNASMGPGGKKGAKAGKTGEKKEKPKEKPPKSEPTSSEATEKGKGGKKDKGKDKGKGKGKGKEVPVVIVHEDKATQMPEEEEIIEEIVEVPEPPKAGEVGWEYTNFAFPDELKITMATFWENAEEVYKEDFMQVFFLKRIILNAIMPFVNYVKWYMNTFITRPDNKQSYLREFQRTYNEFDEDIRNDDEFKAELHCRINEMREQLIEICDRRMMEAELERCRLISRNWVPKQFTELVNDYITGFQIELDRCVDSLQVLSDYYTAVVCKMPNEEAFKKEFLPKLDLEDPRIAEGINKLLTYVVGDESEDPLKDMVEGILLNAKGFVERTRGVAEGVMKKVKALFAPEGKGKKPPKPKKDKKGKGNILTLFEPDDLVKQGSNQILEEWTCAIKGETDRVVLRLDLLKADLFANLDEITDTTQNTFHDIFYQIRTRYDNEVTSVKKACHVLTRAVEEEVKIQEELFLKDDNFFIDPDSILFTDQIPPAKPLTEFQSDEIFTISDLDKITDILLDLAPSGYITQRCLLYLIQDLVITEDGPVRVPEKWKKMEPNEVNRLFQQLFDDVEYTQWKDFILYNFMIPFPSEDELNEMRREFRNHDPDSSELITDYQFLSTRLWFEELTEDEIRTELMKKLLLKLYRVRSDRVNYTAMLLDLSKDENPVRGLGKALGVSLGKSVCWDGVIGEKFVTEFLRRRRYHEEMVRQRDEERRLNIEMADGILTDIIDYTVHICDSVVIEDLNPPEELIEESVAYEGRGDEGSSYRIGGYEIMMGEDEYSGFGFTNTAISFEVEPAPPLAYFLPYDVLISVITTVLPWHAKVQNVEEKSFRESVEDIYDQCKNPEFNFDVLAHEFLNHPKFLQLLSTTSKFSVKIPAQIVEQILAERDEIDNEEVL